MTSYLNLSINHIINLKSKYFNPPSFFYCHYHEFEFKFSKFVINNSHIPLPSPNQSITSIPILWKFTSQVLFPGITPPAFQSSPMPPNYFVPVVTQLLTLWNFLTITINYGVVICPNALLPSYLSMQFIFFLITTYQKAPCLNST